jgi:hypothetical protein
MGRKLRAADDAGHGRDEKRISVRIRNMKKHLPSVQVVCVKFSS